MYFPSRKSVSPPFLIKCVSTQGLPRSIWKCLPPTNHLKCLSFFSLKPLRILYHLTILCFSFRNFRMLQNNLSKTRDKAEARVTTYVFLHILPIQTAKPNTHTTSSTDTRTSLSISNTMRPSILDTT